MTESLRLNVCPHCRLADIDFAGHNFLAVSEVLTSLSSLTPEDPSTLSTADLESIRLSEIEEWGELGEEGKEMAAVLTEIPELVEANYACDLSRYSGTCLLRWAEDVGRKVKREGV